MQISNLSTWAKYIYDPLTLAGFVMMLFTGIVITTLLRKNPKSAILNKLMRYIFVLSLIVVVFSFLYAIIKHEPVSSSKTEIKQKSTGEKSPNIIIGTSPNNVSTEQVSHGKQSPNIISHEKGKGVEINYGDDSPERK
jgi:hypothetical protein